MKIRPAQSIALIIGGIIFSIFSVRTAEVAIPYKSYTFMSYTQARETIETSQNQNLVPFQGNERIGYIDLSTKIMYAFRYPHRAAIDQKGMIHFSQPGEPIIFQNRGQPSYSASIFGVPWLKDERRLIIRGDQMGLAELNQTGEIVWEHEFSSIITGIDANRSDVVVGLLNGSIIQIKKNGAIEYIQTEKSPQISAIYGVALSENSEWIVAIQGLSPQTIISYRMQGEKYHKQHNASLPTNNPKQASLSFSRDGSHVLLAQGSELFCYYPSLHYYYDATKNFLDYHEREKKIKSEFEILGPAGKRSIAVMEIQQSDSKDTQSITVLWILEHGIPIAKFQHAEGFSTHLEAFAIPLSNGVYVLGEQNE